MLKNAAIFPIPKIQELYRLALCTYWIIILLGVWHATDYHPAFLLWPPILFVYQYSSHFISTRSLKGRNNHGTARVLAFIDGLLTGMLLSLSSFQPIIAMAIGLVFLIPIMSSIKPRGPLCLAGLVLSALLTFWLCPFTIIPNSLTQTLLLAAAACFSLLQAKIVRKAYCQLSEKYGAEMLKKELLEVRLFRLSKYLSPPLRKAILSGRNVRAETQEKDLTIFFSDIIDFTPLAEELEPEQLSCFLNTYLSEMCEIACRFGGTVDKVIGDSIMVFFGDPESRGTQADAVACVSMAIAMRRTMQELKQRWRTDGIKQPPALRIGINSGTCKVGNFGTENRLDYTLLGHAVNLASRLESAAQCDEILLSDSTYQLVKTTIHCADKGHISVKGFSKPISVYSAIDANKCLQDKSSAERQ